MATNVNMVVAAGKAAGDAKQFQYSTAVKLEIPRGAGKTYVDVNISGAKMKDAAMIKEGDDVRVLGRIESYKRNKDGKETTEWQITEVSDVRINKDTGYYQFIQVDGRACADADIKSGEKDGRKYTISDINLAVRRTYKNKNGEFINVDSFLPVTVWDAVDVKKGQTLYARGELQSGSYNNKAGEKVRTMKLIVNSKDDIRVEANPKSESNAEQNRPAAASAEQVPSQEFQFMGIDEQDEGMLPF